MIVDEGISISEVALQTGINYRALYRYRDRYIKGKHSPRQKNKEDEIEIYDESPTSNTELQAKLDEKLISRAKFLDDLFATKQIVLKQIAKLSKKSQNLDALQRSLKTINDIENTALPDGEESPAAHVKAVNMFQFINQQLINEGYEGPELSPSDIVKGE